MEQKEKSLSDQIFDVVVEIWGKQKKKSGLCWIAAKFGNDHNWASDAKKRDILACVSSKRDKTQCPVHKRIHDAKV